MEKDKVIALLNKDIEDEHGAIIQYLSHAYSVGEGELACEIEAMSRDEMRHMDWLAETIVALGGIPSVERGTMLMGNGTVADWMRNDAVLEAGAIKQYQEHVGLIDDSRLKRLLERILADEEAHRIKFERLVAKVPEKGVKDLRGNRQDKVTGVLNWGIEHEYTVILQYMLHSYLASDPGAKHELEDQAINEMQHMSWLAEELVSDGGSPILEHSVVRSGKGMADRLHNNIEIEQEVAAEYDRAAGESKDPDLKRLLLRIRNNEIYHIGVFNDLLKEEKK